MKKAIFILILTGLVLSCRKSDYYIENEKVVKDLGGGTGTVTWTSDKSWLLDGFVFVNDGQTLTIEKGTVIRARTGEGSGASALIVSRGGKIIAEGTSQEPIIFTVEGDDLKGSVSLDARGLWGGLIILGNAPVNTESGEGFIEGIPISEPRGVYGGIYEDDNSGIIRYISIRHGGSNIGEDNEINGLTLGGVGRKTIIDHIEIISNADDGVEFFGGTVNCSNIAAAFCDDDAFDFDEGYRGKCQFLLGIRESGKGDRLAEHSGNTSGYLSTITTNPLIYNSTFISEGENPHYLMSFDHSGGGTYRNSVFTGSKKGIAIEYSEGYGSFYRLKSGELVIENNLFASVSGENPDSVFLFFPDTGASAEDFEFLKGVFIPGSNRFENPGLEVTEIPYKLLPPDLDFDQLATYPSAWFEEVGYKGAFGSNNWLEGWSLLWENHIVE